MPSKLLIAILLLTNLSVYAENPADPDWDSFDKVQSDGHYFDDIDRYGAYTLLPNGIKLMLVDREISIPQSFKGVNFQINKPAINLLDGNRTFRVTDLHTTSLDGETPTPPTVQIVYYDDSITAFLVDLGSKGPDQVITNEQYIYIYNKTKHKVLYAQLVFSQKSISAVKSRDYPISLIRTMNAKKIKKNTYKFYADILSYKVINGKSSMNGTKEPISFIYTYNPSFNYGYKCLSSTDNFDCDNNLMPMDAIPLK